MKFIHRAASAALSASLLLGLAACGSTDPQSTQSGTANSLSAAAVTQGAWQETDLTGQVHGTLYDLNTSADGTLLCLAGEEAADGTAQLLLYSSADGGETWQTTPYADLPNADGTARLAPSGAAVVVCFEDGGNGTLQYYTAAGAEPQTIGWSEVGGAYLGSGAPVGETSILVRAQTEDGSWKDALYDLTSQSYLPRKPELGNTVLGRSDNGELLYYIDDGSRLCTLAPDGTQQTNTAVSLPAYVFTGFADAAGNYCFISDEGLFRLAAGGSVTECVIDAGTFAFAAEGYFTAALAAAGDAYFCLVVNQSTQETALYRYSYDPAATPVPQTELTVWSLDDLPTVRLALSQYQRAHADVKISYEVAHSDDSGLSDADILQRLNTELLAGEGPDILVLDGIDPSPYMEKGVLADLSGTAAQTDILPALRDFGASGGVVYVLPARYQAAVLLGSAGDTAQVTDLDAFVDFIKSCPPRRDTDYTEALPQEEQFAVSFKTADEVFRLLMDTSAAAIVQDGALDTDALTRVFEAAAQIGQYYGFAGYRGEQADESIVYMNSDSSEMVYVSEAALAMAGGTARLGWNDVGSASFFPWIEKEAGQTLGFALAPGLCAGAYRPAVLLGVNASGSNQELARDVVLSVFDESIQSTSIGDGLPGTESGLQACIAAACQDGAADPNELTAFLTSVRTPVLVDEVIYSKLLPYAEAAAKGEQSVAEAVSAAAQELEIYLAERN